MKVLNITWTKLATNFVEEGRVKLDRPITIQVTTNAGVITFRVEKDYYTDGRSGPQLLNYVIPKYGRERNFIIFLIHDILFQTQDYTIDFANELLYNSLRWAGHSWFVSKLFGSWGVSGPTAKKAYETQDRWDRLNKNKVIILWGPK